MTDDPQEILKTAGVECVEVEKFYRDYHHFRRTDVPWSALDAIEALALLVARYKGMLERAVVMSLPLREASTNSELFTLTMADLESRWEKR